jgi:hypothetical protein
VEFVLLMSGDTTFVGVGSDHTDRDLERTSVIDSKRSFSKILSREVWPLQDLLRDWDSLLLRSWVTDADGRRLYQQGSISMIMEPTELLALVPEGERVEGLVLYSGTVPAVSEAPAEGFCRFDGEIVTRDGQVLATCSYTYEA